MWLRGGRVHLKLAAKVSICLMLALKAEEGRNLKFLTQDMELQKSTGLGGRLSYQDHCAVPLSHFKLPLPKKPISRFVNSCSLYIDCLREDPQFS